MKLKPILIAVCAFSLHYQAFAQTFHFGNDFLGLSIKQVKEQYQLEPEVQITDEGFISLLFYKDQEFELYGKYRELSIYYFNEEGKCDLEMHSVPFNLLITIVTMLQESSERIGVQQWRDDSLDREFFVYNSSKDYFFWGVTSDVWGSDGYAQILLGLD